ncbi:DUF1801 domain-containing protein [Carnobacterium inhibens]|uniref:DUF1801 domain-containing protein n=1 Tax=Carnobacterium inhibens TaxID=147709 RepID=A0ABR7TEF9_9LACT|nr:DUF1801 domain-containing protein [Carnobacterium inhibens]MBC9825863.1 DUF1801 domain-containing protein [Carnobacterium inhibens]
MTENKMQETTENVMDFVEKIEDDKKRQDAYRLIQLFSEETGNAPKMWGTTIIGFGRYHYKYASGHEGDAAPVGFSPRKAQFSIYLSQPDNEKRASQLTRLGKHKMGKGCLYIKKLDDIDESVLKELVQDSVNYIKETYPDLK